jgi:glutamate N-acetyltransferase/amino-acid N-acetyltransferase
LIDGKNGIELACVVVDCGSRKVRDHASDFQGPLPISRIIYLDPGLMEFRKKNLIYELATVCKQLAPHTNPVNVCNVSSGADLHLLSPKGFQAAGVKAGIKASGKPDVGLLLCDAMASAAAVFTANKVVAAPVVVGREHVAAGKLRGVVVNAGNANACTGKRGEKDARTMCDLTAQAIGCDAKSILPSSTGIIGHMLPMEKVSAGITAAANALGNSAEHSLAFMDAILTTDLKRKNAELSVKIGKEKVVIAGVCKGSGMIGPRLSPPQATMLAYLTTDVIAPAPLLRKLMWNACDSSFNAVTVDDHASTNDTACLLASGFSGVKLDTAAAKEKFAKALDELCQSLAYQIAADGEGATKVVKIVVTAATNPASAKAIARTVANSPLVKCAMHGNDPNWGRIVSAAGYAGVPFDPNRTTLKLQGVTVFRSGQPVPFDAEKTNELLKGPEVVAELICGIGKASATVWTCDLSKDYVTINADYHT